MTYANTRSADCRRPLPLLLPVAAALALTSAGCSSQKSVVSPSAGGTSGTAQVLNDPGASPALKAQAKQQQQMAQQQAQAMQQAQARQQSGGQPQGH